jgi:hypothetical protein
MTLLKRIDQYNSITDAKDWDFVPVECPQQTNRRYFLCFDCMFLIIVHKQHFICFSCFADIECGVFVCMALYCIRFGLPLAYSMADVRNFRSHLTFVSFFGWGAVNNPDISIDTYPEVEEITIDFARRKKIEFFTMCVCLCCFLTPQKTQVLTKEGKLGDYIDFSLEPPAEADDDTDGIPSSARDINKLLSDCPSVEPNYEDEEYMVELYELDHYTTHRSVNECVLCDNNNDTSRPQALCLCCRRLTCIDCIIKLLSSGKKCPQCKVSWAPFRMHQILAPAPCAVVTANIVKLYSKTWTRAVKDVLDARKQLPEDGNDV